MVFKLVRRLNTSSVDANPSVLFDYIQTELSPPYIFLKIKTQLESTTYVNLPLLIAWLNMGINLFETKIIPKTQQLDRNLVLNLKE